MSSNVTIGMLKASQKRIKRPALSAESQSSTPASTKGWFATNPTVSPSIRPKPMTMFWAKSCCISIKSESSATAMIISRTSYGWVGSAGKILLILYSGFGGFAGKAFALRWLFQGIKVSSFLICSKHSCSVKAKK